MCDVLLRSECSLFQRSNVDSKSFLFSIAAVECYSTTGKRMRVMVAPHREMP